MRPSGATVRQAGPDDEVAGVRPRWVALPESTEEVAAVLRSAAEQDLAVVPVGGGSKLHWGPPPERCDVLLDTCCLNQVVEHASGDLVVKVQAGVTMDALAAALATRGQELALDVPVEGATVGGTLATATAGPRSFRYGTARDLLIGITVVLADGTVARSGGKVVKNVAGYDLGKLFTGSHGTLGVIADATFRLHPRAADRRWVTVRQVDDPGSLATVLAASQAEPAAIEVDRAGDDGRAELAVLVEGTAALPRAQALAALTGGAATIEERPPSWWGVLPDEEVLLEVRFPPSRADQVLRATLGLGAAVARGSLASGALWLGGDERLVANVPPLRERLGELGGRVTVVAAPPYQGVDRWGDISALPLMRRVKERFDPGRRMSPGRFVGGI
ncbi:FAD-binding oxidoreductase [Nonomuraea sp. NPDC059194]|uniref:FAD-binding oxidoreductase n=1 Tax=Nonomuraea sp. NPDC059194 TaxID=3346764 RepID=UPI0036CF2C3E